MSGMDLNTVQQDLERRFTAPLPEFYKRRIIFWYDEDQEFKDQLDYLEIPNVKIVSLTGTNTFIVKKLLCEDDIESNYLVYDPRSFLNDDDNWLINVQLYSEEFRADLISIWMDEMELQNKPNFRNLIKNYQKFFRARDRREAIKKFSTNISSPAHIHLAIMSVLCGNKNLDPKKIIKAVIQAGLDLNTNCIYQSFEKYGVTQVFWAMIAQTTGYCENENSNIGRLSCHLLLSASSKTMNLEDLDGLESFISIPHQAYCYDLISDWLHNEDNSYLYTVASYVEEELNLINQFAKLKIDDLLNTEIFPCINECILIILMSEISDNIIDINTIRLTVEKRRTMAWYKSLSCYYECLLQVANMQSFYLDHSSGFHIVEPHKIWAKYTTDYYQMDTYYRLFHLSFQHCLQELNPLLDDLVKNVDEKVEGLYTHWFLNQLGENWSNAILESLETHGQIPGVPQQTDFYKLKVAPYNNRIFVIISDAFRYETAVQLADQLRRETQSEVTLNSFEAIFPTITKFGMAALLPHEKLELVERSNGSLSVMADGQSTESGNREKVLKKVNKASVALKYSNIIGMKRAERSALIKGMQVVYIYHDKVDEASHTSDSSVFSACNDAITEIKNLIRLIVNEFGGINILITADHGFLYNYSPLNEDIKIDKTTPNFLDAEIGRRYLITRQGASPVDLFPVKFIGNDSGFEAWTPRENIRIKKKGEGLKFVHGGISLQEMVVPIIEYKHLRSSYKTYQRNKTKIDTKPVVINLLSASRKISNTTFSLDFYQTEAVSSNREAATYLIYFTDKLGERVSDTQKIIADRINTDVQERTFHCLFNLRPQKYNSLDSYYLIIADDSGIQPQIKEEFQIEIAFKMNDFIPS